MECLTGEQIKNFVEATVKPGATIVSDDFKSYSFLDKPDSKYGHEVVNHSEYEYMNETYLEEVCDAINKSQNENVAEMIIRIIKELYNKYTYRCNKLPDDIIDTIIGPILCFESQDALNIYTKDELDYLLNGKYIKLDNNKVYLTELGFKYYGAVGALFYSKNVKEWFMGV